MQLQRRADGTMLRHARTEVTPSIRKARPRAPSPSSPIALRFHRPCSQPCDEKKFTQRCYVLALDRMGEMMVFLLQGLARAGQELNRRTPPRT